jgi:hypothetical protein
MGFIAPFIPAIGSAIGGIIGGRKATAAAQKRSPEEATALTGAQGAGTALGAQGSSQFATGTGMVKAGQSTLAQPTNYYSRLLSGNRALQSQAVAAPRAAITDTYRGAERNLERSGVRGAARDVASAELGRSRAGAISSLITGVQPGAASALTAIGENQTGMGAGIAGQGSSATSASGGIFGNLLGQGTQNRVYARGEGEKFGQGFGGLIFDLLSQAMKGKGRGSGGGIPASQTGGWGGE